MGTYILVVFMAFAGSTSGQSYGSTHGATTATMEFSSRDKCEAAIVDLKNMVNQLPTSKYYAEHAICLEK